ncbi:MAG: ribosome maturation factor RimP [Actinomycetota bacterium]
MVEVRRIEELVAPVVAASGGRIYDVSFGGNTLRIAVDAEGGAGMDLIHSLTRQLSILLDEHDPIPGSYTLEVSSPGLERPLRRPDHYRWSLGSEVSLKIRTPDGAERLRGILRDADDEAAVLIIDDAERRVAYRDITSAKTVFAWGPTPPKGGRTEPKRKRQPKS